MQQVPKVLCLGVSFPSLDRTCKSKGLDYKDFQHSREDEETRSPEVLKADTDANADSLASSSLLAEQQDTSIRNGNNSLGKRQHREPSTVEEVLDCVKHGLITVMDGRDLARCVATENLCLVQVYTVSQETGAEYRENRHIYANFNRSSFVASLKKHFGKDIQFDQVILDYFWMPPSWNVDHWKTSFFRQTLVNLARFDVLKEPIPPAPHLEENGTAKDSPSMTRGVIYLPFCYHCFKQVVANLDLLAQYYDISFVRKGELKQVTLWAGTQEINPASMQHVLGKRINQEETYCTFGPNDLREALDDSIVSKTRLLGILRRLEDFSDIRFIALSRLAASSWSLNNNHKSNQRRNNLGACEGGITGLLPWPGDVQRGFDQAWSNSKNGAKRKAISAATNIIGVAVASDDDGRARRRRVVSPNLPEANAENTAAVAVVAFDNNHSGCRYVGNPSLSGTNAQSATSALSTETAHKPSCQKQLQFERRKTRKVLAPCVYESPESWANRLRKWRGVVTTPSKQSLASDSTIDSNQPGDDTKILIQESTSRSCVSTTLIAVPVPRESASCRKQLLFEQPNDEEQQRLITVSECGSKVVDIGDKTTTEIEGTRDFCRDAAVIYSSKTQSSDTLKEKKDVQTQSVDSTVDSTSTAVLKTNESTI